MKIINKKVFLILLILFSKNAFSFDSDECFRTFKSLRINGEWEIFLSCNYTSNATTFPFELATSAGHSVISNGPCSAIDFRNQEIMKFIILNHEQLMIDASKGNGEYLVALNSVFSCGKENEERFIKKIKDSYSGLFIYSTPSETYSILIRLIRNDEILDKKCKYLF